MARYGEPMNAERGFSLNGAYGTSREVRRKAYELCAGVRSWSYSVWWHSETRKIFEQNLRRNFDGAEISFQMLCYRLPSGRFTGSQFRKCFDSPSFILNNQNFPSWISFRLAFCVSKIGKNWGRTNWCRKMYLIFVWTEGVFWFRVGPSITIWSTFYPPLK